VLRRRIETTRVTGKVDSDAQYYQQPRLAGIIGRESALLVLIADIRLELIYSR
jgi:hypothetical protein